MYAISTNALSLSEIRGFDVINYPDGAVTMRLSQSKFGRDILLLNSIRTAGDIAKTLLGIDAVKHIYPKSTIQLLNLYNSFLRQDRVATYGDSCGAIFDNAFFGVDIVRNFAPHNGDNWGDSSGFALYRSAYVENVFLQNTPSKRAILGTDRNATKRFGYTPDFYFDKARNLLTGEITQHVLQNTLGLVDGGVTGCLANKDQYIILDDIFDGGRGFTLLLEAMTTVDPEIIDKRIDIIIPHAVFSNPKTLEVLFETYSNLHFWITDSLYHENSVELSSKIPVKYRQQVHIFPIAMALIQKYCVGLSLETNFFTL